MGRTALPWFPNESDIFVCFSQTRPGWIINSYTLSLAAFLLAAGRLSDITSARIVFIGGLLVLGAFSLGIGFSKDKVTLIVLRAFSGIGVGLSLPRSSPTTSRSCGLT